MNREQAITILLTYRSGSSDAEDPEVRAALELATTDAELKKWLDQHWERQNEIKAGFKQIAVPAGFKEQIISEHRARQRAKSVPKLYLAGAVIGSLALLILLASLWIEHQPQATAKNATTFEKEMTRYALRGYTMDLNSENPEEIRNYLAAHNAPANYKLSAGLAETKPIGCSIENWHGTRVTMLCFRSGKGKAAGDLWLFITDAKAMNAAGDGETQFSQVKHLAAAQWTQGDSRYLLEYAGDAAQLKRFL